jgi:acyl carrier protein|tara:strand:+ start:26 stop:250 length:225 start_codon:yes stop_codon:yes gene_type:complete
MNMTPENKIKFLLEALEAENYDNVSLETLLDDIEEWDSIGALMIISEVDDNFGITINPEDLEDIKTVEELVNLF